MANEWIIIIVAAVLAVIPVFVLSALLLALVALVVYLLRAISLALLAKKSGVRFCGLAFVPVVCSRLQGEIAERAENLLDKRPKQRINGKGRVKRHMRTNWGASMLHTTVLSIFLWLILPLCIGAAAVLVACQPSYWWVSVICVLLVGFAAISCSIVGFVLYRMSEWWAYRLFAPHISVALLVISLVLPVATPLCLLIASLHKSPVRVERERVVVIEGEDVCNESSEDGQTAQN